MKYVFRITHAMLAGVHHDLSRAHPFAAERVGFVRCRVGMSSTGTVVLAEHYLPVEDHDYVDDPSVGAMMGPGAMRKALQDAYRHKASMFHIHRHDHRGNPRFSRVDERENAKFVPNFFHVAPAKPHGAIVLSWDRATGRVWPPSPSSPVDLAELHSIGLPLRRLGGRK